MTSGRRSETMAGPSRTCSRTSYAWRRTPTSATTRGTAIAARCPPPGTSRRLNRDRRGRGAGARVGGVPIDRGSQPAGCRWRVPDTHLADIVFDGTRAFGVRLLDGTIVEVRWVV